MTVVLRIPTPVGQLWVANVDGSRAKLPDGVRLVINLTKHPTPGSRCRIIIGGRQVLVWAFEVMCGCWGVLNLSKVCHCLVSEGKFVIFLSLKVGSGRRAWCTSGRTSASPPSAANCVLCWRWRRKGCRPVRVCWCTACRASIEPGRSALRSRRSYIA